MKSYTSLKQSRVLSEILPHESADMGWNVFVDGTTRILPINNWDLIKDGSGNVKFYHAWSLAGLFEVIRQREDCNNLVMHSNRACLYSLETSYYKDSNWQNLECIDSNAVDAFYQMVIRLHEQKLL